MDKSKFLTSRDIRLDVTKGFLVLVMILYHVMNYFFIGRPILYKYLSFVIGSFIFISGLLVTVYYKEKFFNNRKYVYRRLLTRGLKLFLIFSISNIVINLLFEKDYNLGEYSLMMFKDNLFSIYIIGDNRLAAFRILLAISYLLIVSPVFLLLYKYGKVVVIVILILISFLSVNPIDFVNMTYITIGFSGLAMGLLLNREILESSNWKYLNSILLICYLVLLKFISLNLIIYTFGVIVILKFIYDWSDIFSNTFIENALSLCGKYSLISYLGQILFLQIIYRLLSYRTNEYNLIIFGIFAITTTVIIATCYALDYGRARFNAIDKLYLVFIG